MTTLDGAAASGVEWPAAFDAVSDETRAFLTRRRGSFVKSRGWLVRRVLACADALGLVGAGVVSEAFAGQTLDGTLALWPEIAFLGLVVPVWVVAARILGLYSRDEEHTDHSTADELGRVFQLVTALTWLFFVFGYALGPLHPAPAKLVAFWATAIALIVVLRSVGRALARRHIAYLQNTVIVGAGTVGQLVARKLLQHPEYGLNLVGFVDASPRELRPELSHLALLGPPAGLPELVRLLDVERVIVAFSSESDPTTIELLRTIRGHSVQIDVVPRLFDVVGPRFDVRTVEGLPLVGLPPAHLSRSFRLIKRTIDVVVASVGLVLAAPLFAYAAWRIPRESPGSILFRQRRLGLDMHEFTVLKFRTMQTDIDPEEHRAHVRASMSADAAPEPNGLYKLERADAITPFGRFLRRTSLDEIPQLLNVLRGDMSIVGPRPCIPYEVENFAPHHFDRFLVQPGMTGLWQVAARAHATFGEALELDVAYVRNWSLGLDLSLLLRTPLALVRPQGTA